MKAVIKALLFIIRTIIFKPLLVFFEISGIIHQDPKCKWVVSKVINWEAVIWWIVFIIISILLYINYI